MDGQRNTVNRKRMTKTRSAKEQLNWELGNWVSD